MAHVVPATPHRCGMYETARELVVAERGLGVNAHIVDPRPDKKQERTKVQKLTCPACGSDVSIAVGQEEIPARPPAWTEDRGACVAPLDWALQSDMIVSHSGIDDRFDGCPAPRVHLAHGRPNSSYRIERTGGAKILTMYRRMNDDERWKAMVTLWPGFAQYWRLLFDRDVHEFSPFVDLDYWTAGPTQTELAGDPACLIMDIWRMDKDPYHVLHGFARFAEDYPEARLHIVGKDGENPKGIDPLLDALRARGVLGAVRTLTPDVRPIYRAADILLTPHRIATRTVREGMACGLQVVAGEHNPYTPYTGDAENPEEYAVAIRGAWEDLRADRGARGRANRETAEREFRIGPTAEKFVELFERHTGKSAA